MELKQAQDIAVAICTQLQPYCSNINIAGSVRRRKPEVKDIEIVCAPKLVEVKSLDLFGGGDSHFIISPEFKDKVLNLGQIIKGKDMKRYVQINLPEGIKLDLFMPQPHDYIRQYVIRTGSSQYSNLVVATAWKRKGWCGTEDGLRKISQCTEKKINGKSLWKCSHPNPELPPVFEDELSFFKWLELPYLHPSKREVV